MTSIFRKTVANLIERNTTDYYIYLGRLSKDEIHETSEIKYVFTKNWQNRIFMANFNESSASTDIEHLISKIRKLKISVLWFVTPMSRPKNLKDLLKDHGFTPLNYWKSMAIALEKIPERINIPEGLKIKEVFNLEELRIWTDILVKSFEFPKIAVSYKKYFINLGAQNPNFQYYLGFFNGKAVSSAVLYKGGGAAGLFYIGTVPEYRRKGISKAMTCYLLNEAKNEGYTISTLQASEMGYPLYKKIGFEKYYTTDIYRWKNPL
ncbi:MAG: GNAT family N-acetyltransferase [Methanobacterium sp.]